MRAALRSLAAVGLYVLSPANAAEFTGRFSTWIAPVNPKCTCRYKGEHLELGARRCLQTAKGPRVHECVTEQNVTSWRPHDDEACPLASLPALQGPLGPPGRTVASDTRIAGLNLPLTTPL